MARRLINRKEFADKLRCGLTWTYRLQKTDPRFPRAVKLGQHSRRQYWDEAEADEYIEAKIAEGNVAQLAA